MTVREIESFKVEAKKAMEENVLRFLVCKVDPTTRHRQIERPSEDLWEHKYRFVRYLERTEGKKIFLGVVNSVHSEVCNKLLRHYTKVTSVNFRGLFSPIHTDLRLNLARRCQAPPERTSSRNRSTNFSFSPGAVFRGKPKVAAGIPTSLKMLTSRHMLISGRNRRAFSPLILLRAFRIDSTSGSTFFPSYPRRAMYICTSPPEDLAKQMGIADPYSGSRLVKDG